MNARDVWAFAAVLAGCAAGAPLDDGSGTGAATMMPTTTTTAAASTTDPSTTSTSTTDETGTSAAESSGTGGESSTGSTGEPVVAGELYPFDQVHSPITPTIAASIQAIAAAGAQNEGVFAKLGGASSASGNNLICLADMMKVISLPPQLAPTVEFFNANAAGMGTTSFSRVSSAAMAGWTAADVLAGMPSPLANEVAAITPRYALVLLGTHELEQMQPGALYAFADNLVGVVDALSAVGTVPILSTIPQRTAPMGIEAEVPRYNAVIRAIAQGRRIPLLDVHFALSGLVGQGLAGDGVDLSVSVDGMMAPTPCSFDAMNVGFGYNTRNLRTLEALERARQVVAMMPAPDASAPELLGTGTLDDPLVVPGLPFVDMRSTASSPSDALDAYGGFNCGGTDVTGPELVYALTVAQNTTIRAMVFDQGMVDVDLHLLTGLDAGSCVKRDDGLLTGPLQPGTYYLAVDTLGTATAGEFALVVLSEG